MSERFPASVLSPTPVVPSLSSAPGIWTMEQQLQAQAQTLWPLNPGAVDPNFKNVSLLLHGDGTNGAQNNTFVNTPPPGASPYAAYLGGSGNYLTIPNTTSLDFGTGDFTIEFWMYAVNMPNVAGIVGKKTGDTTNGWQVYHNAQNANGKMSIRLTLQIDFASASNWTLNTWEHWAVTRSGTTLRWFKNGVLDAAGSSSANLTDNTLTYIGYSQTWGGYFTGYLSNLRVVKGSALYTSNFTPSTSPLTAVSGTTLLTFQNPTFVDNSSQVQAITAVGSAAMVNSNVAPTITRNGNTTQGSFSPFGTLWSNSFDGTGDVLYNTGSTAFTFGTSPFTVEYWVSQTANTGTYAQHCGASSTANGFSFGVNGLALYMTTSTTGYTASASLTPNTWNHVAWTRDASNMVRCFLNGVLCYGPTSITTNITETSFYIGAASTGATYPMAGNISNLRVIKGTALYTGAFTPPAAPLTAVSGTSLLTCQSNRFIDNSSNGATLTRNGDVAVSRFSPFSPTAAYATSVIGGSAYFDGTGDYLTIPSSAALTIGQSSATVELWVYPTSVSGYLRLISSTSSGFAAGTFCMRFNAGGFIAGAVGVNSITSSIVPVQNQWNHIAWVGVSGLTQTLYVNGVVAGTASSYNLTEAIQFVGGYYSVGPAEFAYGYISDVRVLKGTALYGASFTPPASPLTSIANTSLLLSMTNAAIFDNAMMNDLETVGNAQISTSVKKYGTGSMYFDGTNTGLFGKASPDMALGGGDFTVEAWVYPTASAVQGVISFGNGASVQPYFYLNGTTPTFLWNNTNVATGPAVTLNTWNHIAVTRSGSTVRVFTNGTSGTAASPYTDVFTNGGTYIGVSSLAAQRFTGYIDDLRITKGYARYTANFTPPTAAFNNQ